MPSAYFRKRYNIRHSLEKIVVILCNSLKRTRGLHSQTAVRKCEKNTSTMQWQNLIMIPDFQKCSVVLSITLIFPIFFRFSSYKYRRTSLSAVFLSANSLIHIWNIGQKGQISSQNASFLSANSVFAVQYCGTQITRLICTTLKSSVQVLVSWQFWEFSN